MCLAYRYLRLECWNSYALLKRKNLSYKRYYNHLWVIKLRCSALGKIIKFRIKNLWGFISIWYTRQIKRTTCAFSWSKTKKDSCTSCKKQSDIDLVYYIVAQKSKKITGISIYILQYSLYHRLSMKLANTPQFILQQQTLQHLLDWENLKFYFSFSLNPKWFPSPVCSVSSVISKTHFCPV